MVARINTVAFSGTEVLAIDAQVQMSPGIVAFNIVGLPDKALAESRERVRFARTLADQAQSENVQAPHIAEGPSDRHLVATT